MAKKSKTMRLSDYTIGRLESMSAVLDISQTEVVELAIYAMWWLGVEDGLEDARGKYGIDTRDYRSLIGNAWKRVVGDEILSDLVSGALLAAAGDDFYERG